MSSKLMVSCLKCSLLGFFLLFLQTGFSQYDMKEVDQAFVDNQKLLGTDVVAMIWKGDSLIYKKEMGSFNVKTMAPIASCSKWLTAAMVMKFVDQGKISLDDPVVKYIPIFDKYFKGYITIRQCLSHMTGISDESNLLKKFFERKKYASLEEEVDAFAARDIRAKPGTDFWYGNMGLNIAARVLEVVSKKKFDILIKSQLFVPLGMRKTTFSTMDASAVNPSGGAMSTAEDYMHFLVMMLNKGKYNGVQVLSENAVDEMMKVQDKPSQIKYAPKVAEGLTYALGSWVIDQNNGIATSLASPGLFGTWPMVDFCHGYAYLVFTKNLLEEDRADAHMQIKKLLDKKIPSSCK